ncbi:hypothetical protein CM49_00201 [Paenibacillus sp. P1XP2]|nr:hypothetical protein CM49_00201 [Paenibacillus sp. P1XP2]
MMNEEWKQAEPALSRMEVLKQGDNDPVSIVGESDDLYCIGVGTDAAVFVYEPLPAYAYKLYTEPALPKKQAETEVYHKLAGIPYFPVYYAPATVTSSSAARKERPCTTACSTASLSQGR